MTTAKRVQRMIEWIEQQPAEPKRVVVYGDVDPWVFIGDMMGSGGCSVSSTGGLTDYAMDDGSHVYHINPREEATT